MKKLFCFLLAVLLCSLSLVACDQTDAPTDSSEESSSKATETTSNLPLFTEEPSQPIFSPSQDVTNFVLINVASFGEIVVELYPDVAPETVANFQRLVGNGFYNGLIFHRVISGFMIQGGDPNGNGTGGSGQPIKGEFYANGFENNLSHTRGVLSMARRGDSYDSASSQFFICHVDSPFLDGKYASFGKVVYGMEVVDAIAALNTDYYDKPISDVVIQSMNFVTKNAE